MKHNTIRTTLVAVGLGVGTILGSVGGTAAFAEPPAPPDPGIATVEQAAPAAKQHNPFRLVIDAKTPPKGWRLNVTAATISDAKNATEYSGRFGPLNMTFDYQATGPHSTVLWTIDILDDHKELAGRFTVLATEDGAKPSDYRCNVLALPSTMTTTFHPESGMPQLSIFG